MKYVLKAFFAAIMLLALAACGGGATGGAPQPNQAAPTASGAQPTTPPEPTAASQPTVTPQPTSAPRTTATPQPTSAPRTTVAPQSTDAGAATLLIYRKTGGIMGLDETLTVRVDGALTLETRRGDNKTAQAQPAQLDRLRELIASPEFAKLQRRYQAMGADLFIYNITVPGGTPQNVQTMDGAETPPVLNQLIQELNELRSTL